MTETTSPSIATDPPRDPVDDVDSGDIAWRGKGHPVRWVATAVVGATALSLAAVWTGAFAPMVTQAYPGRGPSRSGDTLVVTVHLDNEALVGTRIVGAGRSAPGADLVGVAVTAGGDRAAPEAGARLPEGGATLGRGRGADVVLRYDLDCARLAASDLAVPVRFRTPLGLTRTVDATAVATADGNLAGAVAGLCGPTPGGDG